MSRRFTFVVLPDTQIYARDHADLFVSQGRWIADNIERLGIGAVIHEGDVVYHNDDAQWAIARRALGDVVGRAELLFALGNHDYGEGGSCSSRTTLLHRYFPYEELAGQPGFGGAFEEGRADNCWHRVETPFGPWLAMALEFAPRDAVVAWADGILAQHADVPAVLATHAYLYRRDQRYDRERWPDQRWRPDAYGAAKLPGGANDGQALWDKLVSRRSNVRIVVCGHVLEPRAARMSDQRADGSWCHQLLCNFQTDRKGGAGYLRLMELVDGGRTMRVRTYSPWTKRWRRTRKNQMELPL